MAGNLFDYQEDSTSNQDTFKISRSLSLSDLTNLISYTINANRDLQRVWVVAELSDVRINGGHCYMELIEKNIAGQTVAKLRATIWANVFRGIREKFYRTTGRDITTGIKVRVRGTAGHHSLYGLSFNINEIDPSYTLGDQERLRREILEKLEKEGIIKDGMSFNQREELIPNPQRIAIISAAGAAGYGDFMNQLENNPDKFVFYPHLFHCIMQGERVAESVIKALDYIEATIDLWDCVAIVRGGGATTDLDGFDNYNLARRVASFPLPVIVGIGHERDRTVLDEIAHTRVKTPTAAAAFFIQTLQELYSRTINSVNEITSYVQNYIHGEKNRLSHYSVSIPALAQANISGAKGKLNEHFVRIPSLVRARLEKEKLKIESKITILDSIRRRYVSLTAGELNLREQTLRSAISGKIEKENTRIARFEELVKVLNPQNTLQRGYAIVRKDRRSISSTKDAKKGDNISIILQDGELSANIN